jgi:hypothetical protein
MRSLTRAALIVGALCLTAPAPASATQTARSVADFEDGLPSGTEARHFAGETQYRVVDLEERRALSATAEGTASGLIFPTRFDPADWPWLEWQWKVDGVLEKGDARVRQGDDYAARVYVIFPHWLPIKTRSINYIWANRLPRDEVQANAFTGNAMMLALRSGDEETGKWVMERRNVVEDYRRLFGEDPPDEALIAVMTDTDQTKSSARAWYDDIRLTR